MDISSDKEVKSQKKQMTSLRKSKPNREIESFLIIAQNIAIRTNYVKAKMDKTQRNTRYRLFGKRDDKINPIVSECN